jgi:hypothetical protein
LKLAKILMLILIALQSQILGFLKQEVPDFTRQSENLTAILLELDAQQPHLLLASYGGGHASRGISRCQNFPAPLQSYKKRRHLPLYLPSFFLAGTCN